MGRESPPARRGAKSVVIRYHFKLSRTAGGGGGEGDPACVQIVSVD